jgi:hypothetical protein
MAESTLTLGFSDLKARVGYHLGYGRTSGSWTAAQTTEIEDVVQSGVRRFYYPGGHEWTFLKPATTMVCWSDIAASASVTVTGVYDSSTYTTVTANTASFYPSMVGRSIVITSTGTYEVYSYTSSTVITVLGNATCSNKTFSIATANLYQLPDDFGAMYGQITFGVDEAHVPIELVGESEIRTLHQAASTGRPVKAAVRPKASTGAAGQRFELYVWPEPDANYNLYFRYHAIPNALSASYPYPLGGAQHSETILAFCLWTAAERIDDDAERYRALAMERLEASVNRDKRLWPRNYGYNSDGDGVSRERWQEGTITHENA